MKKDRKFITTLFVLGYLPMATALSGSNVLYLDGEDDYIEIQRPVSIDFTLECWINLQSMGVSDETPAFCTPVFDNVFNHGDGHFGLYIDGIKPGLALRNPWSVTSPAPIATETWVHIAAVRDLSARESRLYLNGELVDTGSPSYGALEREDRIWIGRNKRTNYLGWEVRLHAYLDECRIWNKALTQSEIKHNMERVLSGTEEGLVTYLNFDDGSFSDCSTAENHGTGYGSPALIPSSTFSGPFAHASQSGQVKPNQPMMDSELVPDLAAVQVDEPGQWLPFTVGEYVQTAETTGPRNYWNTIPEALGNGILEHYSFGNDPAKFSSVEYGKLDFRVLSDGLVWMLTTTRFGASGNSGGNWRPEVTSESDLESMGWEKKYHIIQSEYGNNPPGENNGILSWVLYERQCNAGEEFSIRTEKYHSPVMLRIAGSESKDHIVRPTKMAELLSRQETVGIHNSAIVFKGPWGDGRQPNTGLMFNSSSDYKTNGTVWNFNYRRNDWGVQLIHPVKGGQCIVTIQSDTIHLSTPQHWLEIGYFPKDTGSLVFTDAFNRYFPWTDDSVYNITSFVDPLGNATIKVNSEVVATGRADNVHPIDFTINSGMTFPGASSRANLEFTGEDFPVQWERGYSGILLHPVDNSVNIVSHLTYLPGSLYAPEILVHPVGADRAWGEPVNFSVEAEGSNSLEYQWFFNGESIYGATQSELFIEKLTETMSGQYHVVVKNESLRKTVSKEARLTVAPVEPVKFISQPQSMTVDVNQSVQFSVQVDGTKPFEYQWFFNGKSITSAKSADLLLDHVQSDKAGEYFVVVTNPAGKAVLSEIATLSVIKPQPPSITNATAELSVNWGEPAVLAVSADGSAPFDYQWYFEGAAIEGASGMFYEIPSVTGQHAGLWSVSVSNRTGIAVLAETILIVKPPSPPVIIEQPRDISTDAGTTAVFSVLADGIQPIEYTWFFNNKPLEMERSSTLTIEEVSFDDAGEYSVRVTNPSGVPIRSETARLTVTALEPPVIISEPVDQSLIIGETLRLEVAFSGSFPLAFQWFHQGKSIAGANDSVLEIPITATFQSGTYRVTVSNPLGSVISRLIMVEINDPFAPPPNDQFADRIRVTGINSSLLASNENATREPNEPDHVGFTEGRSIWYTWNALLTSSVQIDTHGSQIDTILAVYSGGNFDQIAEIASNDDDPSGGTASRVEFEVQRGVDYHIVVDSFGNQGGAIKLNLGLNVALPELGIRLSGRNILLSWPETADGFRLQKSGDLVKGTWVDIGLTPVITESRFSLKIPIDEGFSIFRLNRTE